MSRLPRSLLLAGTLLAVAGGIVLLEQQGWRGARLVECLMLLALAALAAWTFAGRARNAFLVVCSLVFGLSILAGVNLVLGTGFRDPRSGRVKDDFGMTHPRPIVGWGATRPGIYHSTMTRADGRAIFDTMVTIDDTLNRKTEPNGRRPIAFFGDSWIFGDGVEDGDTLPQAFADLTGRKIPILNLSYPGWSPAQNLAALEHGLYASLLEKPRHVFLFTALFHVERIGCKRDYAISSAPRYVIEGGKAAYKGSCASALSPIVPPLIRIARNFGLNQNIVPNISKLTRSDVETYIKVIETFVAETRRQFHLETTVFFAPFGDQYIKGTGFTEDQIIESLRKSGLDLVVDQLPPLDDMRRYWIPEDEHPTPLGYRVRAEELKAHLAKVDPGALVP